MNHKISALVTARIEGSSQNRNILRRAFFLFGIRFSHFVTCYFSPYKRIHHPIIFQFPSTNFSPSSNCEICVIFVTLSRYSTATVAVTVSPLLFSTVLFS